MAGAATQHASPPIRSNLERGILPKDATTCGLEESGIKPLIFRWVDKPTRPPEPQPPFQSKLRYIFSTLLYKYKRRSKDTWWPSVPGGLVDTQANSQLVCLFYILHAGVWIPVWFLLIIKGKSYTWEEGFMGSSCLPLTTLWGSFHA